MPPFVLYKTHMIMRVLILSRSNNAHADKVQELCRGHSVRRIDFDFENSAFPEISLPEARATHDAVFVHHPRVSAASDSFQDGIEQKLFQASWGSLQEWLYFSNENALWVNSPLAIQQNRSLLRQHNLARQCGWSVPEMLFTNSIKDLRSFAGEDEIVVKQGNLGVNLDGHAIFVSKVDPSKITDADLVGCPILFQKYVPKEYELRVHVIGGQVLTCQIESQATEKTSVDWRNYDIENTPHSIYQLPKSIEERCIEITQRLNLRFGVIDLIFTPQGEFVFLECNSQGHWLWIEELTSLPITETLTDFLLMQV